MRARILNIKLSYFHRLLTSDTVPLASIDVYKLGLKACLHCGKMNPDPIRIQTGSVVSGSDMVRLRPHCNNSTNFSHVRASRAATCT